MRSNLSYINDAIDAELCVQERGERDLPVNVRPVRVHGFAIPDEITRPAEEAGVRLFRQAEIKSYRDSAVRLRVKLMAAGIEPIAVLPNKAWMTLCNEAGLFRMAPGAHNRIGLNTSVIQRLRAVPASIAAVCVSVALMVAFAAFVSFAWLTAGLWSYDFMPGHLLLILAIAVATIGSGGASHRLMEGWLSAGNFQRNVDRYLAGKTWAQVLRDLAPTGTLEERGIAVDVELPAPPMNVAAIIMLAHKAKLGIHVAAEADAITIPGGIRKIFEVGLAQIVEREEAIRRDPIIYVCEKSEQEWQRDNSAVAILAQYGDFPIEKEVVDRVVASRNVI